MCSCTCMCMFSCLLFNLIFFFLGGEGLLQHCTKDFMDNPEGGILKDSNRRSGKVWGLENEGLGMREGRRRSEPLLGETTCFSSWLMTQLGITLFLTGQIATTACYDSQGKSYIAESGLNLWCSLNALNTFLGKYGLLRLISSELSMVLWGTYEEWDQKRCPQLATWLICFQHICSYYLFTLKSVMNVLTCEFHWLMVMLCYLLEKSWILSKKWVTKSHALENSEFSGVDFQGNVQRMSMWLLFCFRKYNLSLLSFLNKGQNPV